VRRCGQAQKNKTKPKNRPQRSLIVKQPQKQTNKILLQLSFATLGHGSLACFELDYEHSEIRFRTSVTLPAPDITLGIVEHLIRSNLAITDVWLPSITAVLFSGVTPTNAMRPKAEAPAPKREPRFELN
jgi:hypothetical protein